MPRSEPTFPTYSNLKGDLEVHVEWTLGYCEELWNRVLAQQPENSLSLPRRLAFVGLTPGAGVSTLAAAFSYYLTRSVGLRVLLIETDLRNPSSPALGLAPAGAKGLSGVLREKIELKEVIHRVAPLGFYMLPAGEALIAPAAMLSHAALEKLLRAVEPVFDMVVLDTPALSVAPEAMTMIAAANATIPVLRAGQTGPEQGAYWLGKIRAAGGRIGAVALNGVVSPLPTALRNLV
jgi:Mrp family chromosome partitioning ATPase